MNSLTILTIITCYVFGVLSGLYGRVKHGSEPKYLPRKTRR